jgi:hypothetical protein
VTTLQRAAAVLVLVVAGGMLVLGLWRGRG